LSLVFVYLCACNVCVCVCIYIYIYIYVYVELKIINICMYVCVTFCGLVLIFIWLFGCWAGRQLNKSWTALLFPPLSSYCKPCLRRDVNGISFLMFRILGLILCITVPLSPLHVQSWNLIMVDALCYSDETELRLQLLLKTCKVAI